MKHLIAAAAGAVLLAIGLIAGVWYAAGEDAERQSELAARMGDQ